MNEGRPQFSVQSLHRFKNQPLINPGKDRTHELSRALGEGISKMVQKVVKYHSNKRYGIAVFIQFKKDSLRNK